MQPIQSYLGEVVRVERKAVVDALGNDNQVALLAMDPDPLSGHPDPVHQSNLGKHLGIIAISKNN